LSEGLSKDNARLIDTVLANQQSFLGQQQSVGRGLRDTQKVVMPMIRRIFPNLIASEIMSVQPMTTGPTGSIFTTNRTQFVRLPIKFTKSKIDLHWCCDFGNGLEPASVSAIEEWLAQFPKTNYWTQQAGPWSEYYVNIYDDEMLTAFTLRWQNSPQV